MGDARRGVKILPHWLPAPLTIDSLLAAKFRLR
jgi:hypothetical protein